MAKKTSEVENLSLEQAQAEEVQLSAEESAAQAAEKERLIEEAKANLASAAAAYKAAKEAFKALRGRKPMGEIKRGPSGVGNYIKSLITEGKTNEEILVAVAENWPANFTNVGCINWYRNALKKWPNGKRPTSKKESVIQESLVESTEGTDEAA